MKTTATENLERQSSNKKERCVARNADEGIFYGPILNNRLFIIKLLIPLTQMEKEHIQY
jgi:hypothetical protein